MNETATLHLEHVFITIRDAEATLAFYRKIFPGWVVRWEGHADDGGRWVHFGPAGPDQPGYLSLREKRDAAAPDEPYETLRIQHVGFAHPDVRTLEARLEKEGIHPDDRADDGLYRRLYYTDPNGIEMEFVEELGAPPIHRNDGGPIGP